MLPNLGKMNPPSVPYMAIYRANMTPPKESLVVNTDDISVTLTSGPLSFSHSVPMKHFGSGVASMTLGQRQINLPSGSYVKVEALIKSFTDSERERVALAIAEAASLITLRYPHLLDNKLFEGVFNTPNLGVIWSEGPMTLTASPSIPPENMSEALQRDFSNIKKLDASDRARLQLAARWFRRGCEAVNQIDKFLFFWTVLEIYPTKGTVHVARETASLLQQNIYTNIDSSDVKKKLELGPMHSMRGKIVHAGQAFIEDTERGIFEQRLEKLHAIVTVCLRLLGGLSPGDDLTRFIN
jgi:hypothetical protein